MLHAANECPDRLKTERFVQSLDTPLSPLDRKKEFYGLLFESGCPGVVDNILAFRSQVFLGLVRRTDTGIESAIDDDFLRTVDAERASGTAIQRVSTLYREMRKTIYVAGELWEEKMIESNDVDYKRMNELMEPEMRTKYGTVTKRIASATAQTADIGLGVQELGIRLYQNKFGVAPSSEQLLQTHRSALRFILLWADFNRFELLALERRIRRTRNDHEEIEPMSNEEAFNIDADGTLTFIGKDALHDIPRDKLDTSEGRFGCPGKRFIPKLWDWTEEVSLELGLLKP